MTFKAQQLIGFGAGSDAPPIDFSYITSSYDIGAVGNSYTFSANSIGAVPDPGFRRYIVAMMNGIPNPGDTTVGSATIGGQAAIEALEIESTAGTVAIMVRCDYIELNTGTTADFAYTMEDDIFGVGIHIFRLILRSDQELVVFDTAGPGGAVNPLSIALSAPQSSSVFIGAALPRNGVIDGTIGGTMGFTAEHDVADANSGEFFYGIGGIVSAPFIGQTVTYTDATMIAVDAVLAGAIFTQQ